MLGHLPLAEEIRGDLELALGVYGVPLLEERHEGEVLVRLLAQADVAVFLGLGLGAPLVQDVVSRDSSAERPHLADGPGRLVVDDPVVGEPGEPHDRRGEVPKLDVQAPIA